MSKSTMTFARRLATGAVAVLIATQAHALTEVKMITFGGASVLPVWIAQDKGLFEKEGLKVTRETTRNSREQIKNMFEGNYQFASTAFDNLVAYHNGTGAAKYENFDVVAILGVHGGMNSVLATPEIKTWNDIRGKTLAVDAVRSGYATVLYQILRKHGIGEKDYKVIAVGNTGARVKAMKEGLAQMGIVSSPDDLQLQREGFNILADTSQEIGQYQGSSYAVKRTYIKSNPKETLAFARAIMAAHEVIHNDRATAYEVLRKHVKRLSDEQVNAMLDRMRGPSGFFRRAELSKEGIENVFKLRAVYGGEKPVTDFSKYIDPTVAQRAMSGK